MNVTVSLNDDLVKKIRKIAVDRHTTLTRMVREYLETVAAEKNASTPHRHQLEALDRSFEQFQFKIGQRTWTRSGLYDRR
jgi:predicted transcriptional regulator